MKAAFVTSTFLLISFCQHGQSISEPGQKDFTKWIHTYYKNPSPDSLFIVYNYYLSQTSSQDPDMPFLGFVASALRADQISLESFYRKVSATSSKDLVESFGWILWYINSERSRNMLHELADLPNQKKNKKFLNATIKKPPVNIYKDLQFYQPSMLWPDFFATGNRETLYLILSKIDGYESTKWIESQTAMDVVLDVKYLGEQDRQIIEYCKTYLSVSKEPTTRILTQIINDIE